MAFTSLEETADGGDGGGGSRRPVWAERSSAADLGAAFFLPRVLQPPRTRHSASKPIQATTRTAWPSLARVQIGRVTDWLRAARPAQAAAASALTDTDSHRMPSESYRRSSAGQGGLPLA